MCKVLHEEKNMSVSIEEKEDVKVKQDGAVRLEGDWSEKQQSGQSENEDEESLFQLLSPSQWRSIWSARMAEDLSKVYGAAMLGSTSEFLPPAFLPLDASHL